MKCLMTPKSTLNKHNFIHLSETPYSSLRRAVFIIGLIPLFSSEKPIQTVSRSSYKVFQTITRRQVYLPSIFIAIGKEMVA